jgi:hypothetical protein
VTSIIGVVLSLGLRILEAFLLKGKADKEAMELFYKFLEKFSESYLNSKKLRDRARAQLEWLKTNPWKETK